MLRLPPTLSMETLIAGADASQAVEAAAPQDAKKKGAAPSTCGLGSSCGYRTLLG